MLHNVITTLTTPGDVLVLLVIIHGAINITFMAFTVCRLPVRCHYQYNYFTVAGIICRHNSITRVKSQLPPPPQSPPPENNVQEQGSKTIPSVSTNYVLQPLLAYIIFSMQSASIDNIRKATLGYFTTAQILEAKDAL